MNENKLKELYEAEINNSAPDFDKLWEKIDNNLAPKESIAPEIKLTPKKSPMNAVKAIAALAAGLALVAFIPSLFSANQFSADMSESAGFDAPADAADVQNSVIMEEASDNAADAMEEEAASDDMSEDVQEEEMLISYEDLSFNSYSETIFTCTGTPRGGEYFVEDEVLADADYIVSATVKNVSLSDDGSRIIYELEADVSYPEITSETIIVESCSAYTMKRGREYLIPVAETADGYRTVYDNIPQIEFTADGGLVYYNGWSSLDDDTSQSIIYPQKTVDDFFYDRMKFSYSGDYSAMIQKFYDAKEL